MNIANTKAVYSNYNAIQTAKKQDTTSQQPLASDPNTRESNSNGLDMRNVSQEDIRTLAKITGDDRIWQYIPFEEFEFKGNTLVGVENKDYLGTLERRIEYNRSIGQPTTGYEETLAALKNYQGYILPKNINERA
ncbi:hypothetical protein L1077_15775 [Pseudoalteromonas luteoviolacea]|uniref:hypothetical protein n=1 Tax=Pseudoalteromonas luteoviolacea TaxID=43657 RepID=UPI001F1CC184|nr:hypothetical protein [Pseudoalteromonas luteoviolacea]MCF6440897.1 hypothetical protein [Pseudoalteromonas luteoviolacea]